MRWEKKKVRGRKGTEQERRRYTVEVKRNKQREKKKRERQIQRTYELKDAEQQGTSATRISFSQSVSRTKWEKRKMFSPLSSFLFCLRRAGDTFHLHLLGIQLQVTQRQVEICVSEGCIHPLMDTLAVDGTIQIKESSGPKNNPFFFIRLVSRLKCHFPALEQTFLKQLHFFS